MSSVPSGKNRHWIVHPAFMSMAALLFMTIGLSARIVGMQNASTALPPGIQVQTQASPKTVTVGDPIRIDITISMPPGYHAHMQPPGQEAGAFSILGFNQEIQRSPGRNTEPVEHYNAKIVAAVYRTGSFAFPQVPIQLQTPEGRQFTLASSPATIQVQSVLSGNDENLRDLKKQEEIPEPFRWALWLTLLTALVLAAVIGWLLWRRRKKRDIIPSVPAPDRMDSAEAELRNLLASGMPEHGRVKEFYVRLSDIIRQILEAAYGIHAAEKTTPEIMEILDKREARVPEENMRRVESLLLRCDIVKFAKYIPSNEEHTSAGQDALSILESSRHFLLESSRAGQPAAGPQGRSL